ncbi:carbohydrate deacetylase [Moritella sp. F3]|uniref:carbohydrate deacetylase n=1 Tax=Moritella sp. F3 TaxID=2718882 RepID=UPI0018E14F1A|nr:carbohydrate deacetylase [Moritella sp. F3]GIC76844.1 carbohydrate deacetylase [Moritella sp. F1]GIC81030.1 carbohydrate deacetylase [Moritella sp. F3]
MKLIVNIDDLGLTEKVNESVVACFKIGVVQSTTIMMNQPATDHAIELIKLGLIPNVGLHVTLTSGKPILDPSLVPDLVDSDGFFLKQDKVIASETLSFDQAYSEFKAQYDKAINAGIKLTHIDSHHFAAVFPPYKKAFIAFANDTGIPVRRVDHVTSGSEGLTVPTTERFSARFYAEGVTLVQLQALILEFNAEIPDGTLELMSHTTLAGDTLLPTLSSYVDKRVDEFNILTSQALKDWLEVNRIECVSFTSVN